MKNGKRKKVLLINSPPPGIYSKIEKILFPKTPPLGLLYIGEILRCNNFKVTILDLFAQKMTERDFMETLINTDPMIIGISSTTVTFPTAIYICAYIKRLLPSAFVVMGGVHATNSYKEALSSGADVVVMGEGEFGMLELAHLVCDNVNSAVSNLDNILGIAFKADNQIRLTPSRPLLKNLDILPVPQREELLSLEPYKKCCLNLMSSRGCGGGCIFCIDRLATCRERNPHSVVKEFFYLHQLKDSYPIMFEDPNFTNNKEKTSKICKLIQEKNDDTKWICSSRVDSISIDILKEMHNAGCEKISLGVESGDERVLKSIGKHITLEEVEKGIMSCQQVGLSVRCSFMVGHHTDTLESIKHTLDYIVYLIEKYDIDFGVSINTPFVGTPLFNTPEKFGIKILSRRWEEYSCIMPIHETRFLSCQDIEEGFYNIFNTAMHYKKSFTIEGFE